MNGCSSVKWSIADIKAWEGRTSLPDCSSRNSASLLLLLYISGMVPLHVLKLVTIDTDFDMRGSQGPCVICRGLRKLRSERIGLPGSAQWLTIDFNVRKVEAAEKKVDTYNRRAPGVKPPIPLLWNEICRRVKDFSKMSNYCFTSYHAHNHTEAEENSRWRSEGTSDIIQPIAPCRQDKVLHL